MHKSISLLSAPNRTYRGVRAVSVTAPLIMKHAKGLTLKRGSLEGASYSAEYSCAVSSHSFKEATGRARNSSTPSRVRAKSRRKTNASQKSSSKSRVGSSHHSKPREAKKTGVRKKK